MAGHGCGPVPLGWVTPPRASFKNVVQKRHRFWLVTRCSQLCFSYKETKCNLFFPFMSSSRFWPEIAVPTTPPGRWEQSLKKRGERGEQLEWENQKK